MRDAQKFNIKLIDRYLLDQASEEELEVFFNLMKEKDFQYLVERRTEDLLRPKHVAYERKNKRFSFIRYAAAVLLVTGSVFAFYFLKHQQNNTILPGRDRAILEFANGEIIDIDTLSASNTPRNRDLHVYKNAAGTLVFSPAQEQNSSNTAFNLVRTPIGGQINIILPDSTKVWLNAGSTIEFPTVFGKETRKVKINGEAYFEVAHRSNHPFVVESTNQETKVLGTKFNISNYTEETITKTSLIEGSVVVIEKNTGKSLHLLPGFETVLNGTSFSIQKMDSKTAIAWKNGDFIFHNENLESILQKISRWYDIEIVYPQDNQKIKNIKFSGSTSRFSEFKDVLEMLELTEAVRFKINGRRVTVI